MKTIRPLSQLILPYVLAFDALLVLAHVLQGTGVHFTASRYFDLDKERSIGTWWSANQLLLAGVSVGLAARVLQGHRSPSRRFLVLLASGLIFLSIDEAVSIHERITTFTNRFVDWLPKFNETRGAWVSVYGGIGLILVVFTVRDIVYLLRNHPRPSLVVTAGFISLVAGAVGVEVIGLYHGLIRPEWFQVALEEALEIVAGSLIMLGCLMFYEDVASRSSVSTPTQR